MQYAPDARLLISCCWPTKKTARGIVIIKSNSPTIIAAMFFCFGIPEWGGIDVVFVSVVTTGGSVGAAVVVVVVVVADGGGTISESDGLGVNETGDESTGADVVVVVEVTTGSGGGSTGSGVVGLVFVCAASKISAINSIKICGKISLFIQINRNRCIKSRAKNTNLFNAQC